MNLFRFRSNLFYSAVSRRVPEGCLLPWWALGLRTVLFPLETLGYFLSRPNHYDVCTDTYLIHGVRYAGALFRAFAAPNEESVYRLKRMGDVIIVERVTLPVPQQEVNG